MHNCFNEVIKYKRISDNDINDHNNTGGAKNLYIFQHTVSLEPFKKNEMVFTKMFLEISGNKDWVAIFM